jgi:hypothetical protein
VYTRYIFFSYSDWKSVTTNTFFFYLKITELNTTYGHITIHVTTSRRLWAGTVSTAKHIMYVFVVDVRYFLNFTHLLFYFLCISIILYYLYARPFTSCNLYPSCKAESLPFILSAVSLFKFLWSLLAAVPQKCPYFDAVVGLAWSNDPEAMLSVAQLLVGPPMPDRLNVMTQTKRNTLILQVGVGRGADILIPYKISC